MYIFAIYVICVYYLICVHIKYVYHMFMYHVYNYWPLLLESHTLTWRGKKKKSWKCLDPMKDWSSQNLFLRNVQKSAWFHSYQHRIQVCPCSNPNAEEVVKNKGTYETPWGCQCRKFHINLEGTYDAQWDRAHWGGQVLEENVCSW